VNPDGRSAVYWGGSEGPPRIWKADTESGVAAAITENTSAAMHPTFSWDGQQIAFVSNRHLDVASPSLEAYADPRHYQVRSGQAFNVYVMDARGGGVRRLTSGAFRDERPTFSPDGSRVAFVSNRGGQRNEIWIVDTDGASPPYRVLISSDEMWGRRPWFSVDGRELYFFGPRKTDATHQLYRVGIDGSEPIPLANDELGRSHGPFVDATRGVILLHSTRGASRGDRIWELPLDGGPPRLHQPPGFKSAAHATRSENGVLVFDQNRWSRLVFGSSRITSRLHTLLDPPRPPE